MKLEIRELGTTVVMTLLGVIAAHAAQPASLFKGGSYDGYARQTATAVTLPASPTDWIFMGGGYDGYSRLLLGSATIPPGPQRGSLILLQ
jgi:hypothetical protein